MNGIRLGLVALLAGHLASAQAQVRGSGPHPVSRPSARAGLAASDVSALSGALSRPELLSRIDALRAPWIVPDKPEAGVLTPAAREAAIGRVILSLAAQPEAAQSLAPALGDERVARLKAAAELMHPKQLEFLRQETDLGAPGAAERVAAALNAYFDAREAAQPAASTEPEEPYRVSTSKRGLKTAVVTGRYDEALEARLRSEGVHVVKIPAPARADAERLASAGFSLAPAKLRWMQPVRSKDEYLEALPNSAKRGKFKNQLKQSEKLELSVGPLTEADYAEWLGIYLKEVVGKEGGLQVYTPDLVSKAAASGEDRWWSGVFFRDPATRRMVGGAIVNEWPERGFVTIAGAAYAQEYKKYEMSVRTFMEALSLAGRLGWKLLSYGSDLNFYGYDFSLGLMGYKSAVRMQPFPEGDMELLKVLDSSRIAAVLDKAGRSLGYFFFEAPAGGALWNRYFEARDRGEKPLGQQLLGAGYYEKGSLGAGELLGRHVGDTDESLQTPPGVPLAPTAPLSPEG